MRILLLGADGYLGWPTAMYFSARGHDVFALDNGAKRRWEAEVLARPLEPLPSFVDRVRIWNEVARPLGHAPLQADDCDISTDFQRLAEILRTFRPEAIVHYAEQPSAPYSMASRANAVETQRNNVVGTLNLMFAMRHELPDAHMVKLGTMGEYGTPNIDIEEGWLELEHNGRRDRVLFPKKPGSFYHLSKVHDSANLEFACRIWDMRVTDLNQGVVYGIDTDETGLAPGLHTSFHYDAVFGTILNRFVTQAVAGLPLTLYGSGTQRRGFLNIRDTLRCVELATLNPARRGEFRVFNQMTEQFSLVDLADLTRAAAAAEGIVVTIDHVPNPRVEQEGHYYNIKHTGLIELGLEPHLLSVDMVRQMIRNVRLHLSAIDVNSLSPAISWRKPEVEPSSRMGPAEAKFRTA